jgi:hypothetical protein
MANKDKMLNLPWQIGREFTVFVNDELLLCCFRLIFFFQNRLVVSDVEEIITKAKQQFPELVIHTTGTITHTSSSLKGFRRALVDIELLSRCNDFIITGGSSFGFTSSLRSRRYPWYVNGKINAKSCERFIFSRPSRTNNWLMF